MRKQLFLDSALTVSNADVVLCGFHKEGQFFVVPGQQESGFTSKKIVQKMRPYPPPE